MVSTNFWSETPDSGPRTFLSRYARFNRTYNQIGKCNNSLLSTLLFLFQPTPRQEKKKGKEEETNQLIKRGAQVKFIWKKGRGARTKGKGRSRAGRRGGGKRIRVTLVIFHTIFNDGSFNWTLHACLHGTRERRMQIGQWQMILLFPCLASCMRLLRPGIVPIPQAGRRLSTRIFFARSFVRRRIPRSSRLDAARGATMNEEKKRRSVTGPLSSPLLWWRRFILAISTHPSSLGQPKIFFISFVDAAKASTLFPRDSVQLRDWFHLRENFVAKSVIVLDFGPVRFYT